VRLHETTAVRAIAPPGERILGAYEDGTLWEWDLTSGGRPDYRILFSQQGLRLSRIGLAPGRIVWAKAERELLFFDAAADEWQRMARIPLEQTCSDFSVTGSVLAVLGIDEGTKCQVVDLDAMTIALEARMPETSVFATAGRELLVYRADDARLRLEARGDYARLACEIPCQAATCVDIRVTNKDELLVAWGQADGRALLVRIRPGEDGARRDEVFASKVHAGPVTSLFFMGEDTLISGGGDRVIAVTRISGAADTAPPIQRLERSLRCTGLCIEGLVPENQRQRLEELIARAQRDLVSP
jgi:hypothetical protein